MNGAARMNSPEWRIFETADELADHGAAWLCALACASDGEFAVCLSGGSTPRDLYGRLAAPAVSSRFPWRRVHWFWGDERFVPHAHPESNYRMAREAFLSHVDVPAANIHPIPTTCASPEQAAADYEAELRRFYGTWSLAPGRPLFGATLLGIGKDGHTASLFPGQPALDEQQRWALAIDDAAPQPRITLTVPVLQSSRDLAFVVAGAGKREVLRQVQAGDRSLPAARIRPEGRLHWFTDRAAAGG